MLTVKDGIVVFDSTMGSDAGVGSGELGENWFYIVIPCYYLNNNCISERKLNLLRYI